MNISIKEYAETRIWILKGWIKLSLDEREIEKFQTEIANLKREYLDVEYTYIL